jgi:dihydrofolate synthase/folylpolyglutamate synthase
LASVTIPGEQNRLPAETIAEVARSLGVNAAAAASADAALTDFVAGSSAGRVLICGSLHFAGAVLRQNS